MVPHQMVCATKSHLMVNLVHWGKIPIWPRVVHFYFLFFFSEPETVLCYLGSCAPRCPNTCLAAWLHSIVSQWKKASFHSSILFIYFFRFKSKNRQNQTFFTTQSPFFGQICTILFPPLSNPRAQRAFYILLRRRRGAKAKQRFKTTETLLRQITYLCD